MTRVAGPAQAVFNARQSHSEAGVHISTHGIGPGVAKRLVSSEFHIE